jgi:hypothetical protein
MGKKPKNVRTFIVPISCMYSTLNHRNFVVQKHVGGFVQSIQHGAQNDLDSRETKMEFVGITVRHIMSEVFFCLGYSWQRSDLSMR